MVGSVAWVDCRLCKPFRRYPRSSIFRFIPIIVIRAKCSNGKPAGLKSSFIKDELSREVSVLRAYEGRGAIHVLIQIRSGVWPCWNVPTLAHRCHQLRMMRMRLVSFAKYFAPSPSCAATGSRYPSMRQHFVAIERYRERFDDETIAAPLPKNWVENADSKNNHSFKRIEQVANIASGIDNFLS